MRADRRAFADRLYAESQAHDAEQADRLARWRNVEPETAELLAVLVHGAGARRILEVGTSNGYSTLWLGDAAEAIGGSVVSLEVDAERAALARQHLALAGLGEVVEVRTEDAGAALPALEGPFDLVFLDAERPAYVAYWPDLVRLLAHPGLLAVDNVLSHADQVADFRALVDADDRVTSALVPIGAGVLLISRAR